MNHPIHASINAFNSFQSLLLKGLLLLMATAFVQHAAAQGRTSLATQAAQLCQEKKLDDAMTTVQLALEDGTEKNQAYTWYVYGFICKEIYKSRESQVRTSTHRMLAIDAFIKAEKMHSNGEVSTNAPLRYLVNTLYNDALLQASEINLDNESSADALFEDYRRVAILSNVQLDTEINSNEIQFIKAKAQHFFEIWSAQPEKEETIQRSVALYSRLLEINPMDCMTVYNIGVAYFNQAILQARAEGLDVMDMTRTKIAHSYFEKASSLCPDDIMIQTALQLASKDQPVDKDQTKKLAIKKK